MGDNHDYKGWSEGKRKPQGPGRSFWQFFRIIADAIRSFFAIFSAGKLRSLRFTFPWNLEPPPAERTNKFGFKNTYLITYIYYIYSTVKMLHKVEQSRTGRRRFCNM